MTGDDAIVVGGGHKGREQLGRSTTARSWHIATAYNVLASGSAEQATAGCGRLCAVSSRTPTR